MFYVRSMPIARPADPIFAMAALTGWREARIRRCFNDVACDDPVRIGRGLDGIAALLDAGAPEAWVAAIFRRRGLVGSALDVRLALIRDRRVPRA